MNELFKTVAFVIAAGLLGVWATFSFYSTRPREISGFELVGEEFFANFTDPTLAKSLVVSAYDEESGKPRSFEVSYSDGLWRIPSQYGYPAEAADRLAKTATSLLGVRRESIVARRESEHARFGVVDPADGNADAESAGKRITLKDANGEILADYIIGKPAEPGNDVDSVMAVRDANRKSDYYYVRVAGDPGEKETYMAKVDIDLSTRFTDWIQPDLLQVDREEINKIEIDSYELVETVVDRQLQFSKIVDGQFRLTREGFSPWKLEGINDATEELDSDRVDELLDLLDEMEIVGVRPKATIDGKPLVRSDLTVNVELARANPESFQEQMYSLQQDLEEKGFVIGADEKDPSKLKLLSTKGELHATTKNGVAYTLFYGNGTSAEVSEIKINDDSEPAPDSAAVATDEPKEETAAEFEKPAVADLKNRYVAIRVEFDQTALGEIPVEPVQPIEPAKPEGYDSWKAEQDKKKEEASSIDDKPQENVEDPQSAGDPVADDAPIPPEDVAAQSDETFTEYESALAAHIQLRLQYTTDLETYETAKSAYDSREKAGRELVKELNERFGQWYYVVPSSSMETVKLKREELVKPRETTPPPIDAPSFPPSDPSEADGLPRRPDISVPDLPDAPLNEPGSDPAESSATPDPSEVPAENDGGEAENEKDGLQ